MKKRIIGMVALGIVALLAIAVLVLYLIPVNYMPKLEKAEVMKVYKTSSLSASFQKDSDKYNEIWDEYERSFTQNLLSAIFAGQTSVTSTDGELEIKETAPSFDMKIVFNYQDAQKITVNGYEQNVAINQVIIQVQNTSTYTNTSVYFRQVGNTSDSAKYYYMSTLSKQDALYNIINDLVIPN